MGLVVVLTEAITYREAEGDKSTEWLVLATLTGGAFLATLGKSFLAKWEAQEKVALEALPYKWSQLSDDKLASHCQMRWEMKAPRTF